jgi:DNA-directed RNA polymerase subunit K/omega
MTPLEIFVAKIIAAEPALRRIDPDNPVSVALRELEKNLAEAERGVE